MTVQLWQIAVGLVAVFFAAYKIWKPAMQMLQNPITRGCCILMLGINLIGLGASQQAIQPTALDVYDVAAFRSVATNSNQFDKELFESLIEKKQVENEQYQKMNPQFLHQSAIICSILSGIALTIIGLISIIAACDPGSSRRYY